MQDYLRRLQTGTAAAETSLERSLARIHGLEESNSENTPLRWFGRGQVLNKLPATILVHNPSERDVRTAHSIRIATNASSFATGAAMIIVRGDDRRPVLAQIESASNEEFDELIFLASVPALGSATFSVEATGKSVAGVAERTTTQLLGGKGTRIVRGGCLSIEVAESSGEMVNIEMPWAFDRAKTREDSLKVALRAKFVAYTNTSSGSYAFVPHSPAAPVPSPGVVQKSLSLGPLTARVTQEWPQTGLTKTVTIATSADDTLCAAVSVHAGTRRAVANGTELVLRFESDILNGEPPVLETDNGLAMVKWTYNASCVTSCSHKDILGGNYRAALNRAAIADSPPHGFRV